MQHTFLGEVASSLYHKYGNEIENLTIVFPSLRARLFFSEALSQATQQRVIWQPRYISMDDIMCEASSYRKGDKIRILTEFYKIYSRHHNESFDKFYHWGEILLNDFDMIDKYMIDADMLFSNIFDLKELEADISYITPEMRETINQFWSHFQEQESLSAYKVRFLKIWKSLAPIYHTLRQRLKELNIGYTGMIYRSAADNLKQGVINFKTGQHYVFVGFNALSECEKQVLTFLQNNYKTDFFWDYDSYYTDDTNQEAGMFLRDNIKKFTPSHDITHDNFLNIKKKITVISTSSNIIQCKYIDTLLREIEPKYRIDKDTAIVLTDENLLMPLLHSLPAPMEQESNSALNITMGYPIRHTPAYSLLIRLFELQKGAREKDSEANFYHVDVLGILSHPYIAEHIGELGKKLQSEILDGRHLRVSQQLFTENHLLSTIFRKTGDWESLYKYLIDVISAISSSIADKRELATLTQSYMLILSDNIRQISNTISNCDIDISTSIYTLLLKRHLQGVRIPFNGEPLQGLQIMGILETRNLDFKNVILLSMNDDNFPGKLSGDSSFIPYNLRLAYGIPTPEHHEGVYAYYFYRLIQRAERVDMLYCSMSDDKSTGEKSRYIHQLTFESPYKIEHRNIGVNVAAGSHSPIVIEKQGEVWRALSSYLNNPQKSLSPSAFSPYITCPLKFYFSSIAKIRTTDTLNEEVDNPMFGNILHKAMQQLYTPLIGIANPKAELEHMLKGHKVEEVVIKVINSEYAKGYNLSAAEYSGNLLLVKNIVVDYIRKSIIPYDIAHNDFAVMSLEKEIYYDIQLQDGSIVKVGGIADRIDSLDDGALRVIDYKTGQGHNEINGVESTFSNTSSATNYPLQTLLYSMILNKLTQRNILPALYTVKNMVKPDFTPYLIDLDASRKPVNYLSYSDDFEQLLQQKLSELFNSEIAFCQCDKQNESLCKYCDYKLICRR